MNRHIKNYPVRAEPSTAAALLMLAVIGASGQTSAEAQPPSSPRVTPQEAAPAAAQGPAYTASNIALAFTYIDGNKDARISREEAAGFRGVAKYFDEADVDKDGFLSREEFENAMNRSKRK